MQGRGGSTGYDNAVALPARSDSDELQKENNKSVAALKGQAVFSVAKARTVQAVTISPTCSAQSIQTCMYRAGVCLLMAAEGVMLLLRQRHTIYYSFFVNTVGLTSVVMCCLT